LPKDLGFLRAPYLFRHERKDSRRGYLSRSKDPSEGEKEGRKERRREGGRKGGREGGKVTFQEEPGW